MWKKIKQWILGKIEAVLLREIDKLDKYEAMLMNLIQENLDPDEKAAKLLKKAEVELSKLIDKAFSWGFFSSALFSGVKATLKKEVENLKTHEGDVANLIEAGMDQVEDQAVVLVDMAQDYLKALVKKYMSKI